MSNKKCWICGRTKEDIESMMDKVIEEDVADLMNLKPEDDKFEFFKKNKFYLCGICWRLLNGFIDSRHKCLHDIDHLDELLAENTKQEEGRGREE